MKKRIALAAVAALAGGLLVAAPASAAAVANGFTFSNVVAGSLAGAGTDAVSATQYSGANNYSTVSTTGTGITVVPGETETYLSVTGSTFLSTDKVGVTLNAAASIASVDTSAAASVNVATPVNGTIVVKYLVRTWVNGIATDTTVQTLTLTVTSSPAAAAYNHTEVSKLGAFADGANAYTDANGAAFVPAAIATPAVPETVTSFTISQYSSTDSSTLAGTSLTKAVTVSLSGVGVLNAPGYNNVTYIAYPAGGAAVDTITVSRDGRSGVATVTIAVDGVVVATRTVTFYGKVASYAVSIDKAQIQASETAILTIVKKDANGIAVPGLVYTLTDETATVGTRYEYVPGTDTYTVSGSTPASKFAAKLTVGNGSIETKTVVANFVTDGAKTVTLTADKASYAPGEKISFTVSAKNSDGVVAGDGTYVLALGGSAALYPAVTSVKLVNGTASFTQYAPVLQGPVVLTATLKGADLVASDAATLNLTVVDPAAVAQAAAITALQTNLATLTTTVASLVASMTAQIKVINATLLKIQKAVAALRTQVNKL